MGVEIPVSRKLILASCSRVLQVCIAPYLARTDKPLAPQPSPPSALCFTLSIKFPQMSCLYFAHHPCGTAMPVKTNPSAPKHGTQCARNTTLPPPSLKSPLHNMPHPTVLHHFDIVFPFFLLDSCSLLLFYYCGYQTLPWYPGAPEIAPKASAFYNRDITALNLVPWHQGRNIYNLIVMVVYSLTIISRIF
jgi:hypothetical protein